MKPRLSVFFPSLESGGLERALIRITAALADRGFDIEVVTLNRGGTTPEETPWDPRVRFTRIRPFAGSLFGTARGRGAAALAMLPGLAALWARRRPDCVLTVQSSLFCIPLARAFGIPVIHRESSNSLEAMGRHPTAWKRRGVLGGKSVVYRACAFVVANAAGAARSARTLTGFSSSRVRVVPNPVDVVALARAAAAPLSDPTVAGWVDADLDVIAWVGRLSWEKNAALMLSAFARLDRDEFSRARLVFAGDGRDRPHLESLAASLGVADRVRFTGHLQNPHALVARARLYALTSLYEGLPNALLEAAALGVPAVSTDCPTGPREILADGAGGLLVPVGDEAALAGALATALRDRTAAASRARRALEGLHRFHPAVVGGAYARLILDAMRGIEESGSDIS